LNSVLVNNLYKGLSEEVVREHMMVDMMRAYDDDDESI
jgi:hypothetical protein